MIRPVPLIKRRPRWKKHVVWHEVLVVRRAFFCIRLRQRVVVWFERIERRRQPYSKWEYRTIERR